MFARPRAAGSSFLELKRSAQRERFEAKKRKPTVVPVHTSFRASDSYCSLDDAIIDLDVDHASATVSASGCLGPRSARVLRTMLDALDSVTSAIRLRTKGVYDISEEFVAVLVEAGIRRRNLRLPGLLLESPEPAVRRAVERWAGDLGARAGRDVITLAPASG